VQETSLVTSAFRGFHKGLLIAYPEWIFLSTPDTVSQITLGSPVPGPIFSMACLISTVDQA
jgi:hypothetical protein